MFDWGANFRCVGRLVCVTEFGHLICVFIKLYSTDIYSVCGGSEIKKQKKKNEQVQCPSFAAEVLAVGRQRDTWQRKAPSWHWGAWRRPSTSSLKWLCPRTWTGCRNTTVTYWRWQLTSYLTSTSLTSPLQMDNTSLLSRFISTSKASNGNAFTRSRSTPAGRSRFKSFLTSLLDW